MEAGGSRPVAVVDGIGIDLMAQVAQADADMARVAASVEQAKSQIVSAEASLTQTQATLERSQALRTLQQIPGEKLDEATLRLIASLAEYLDDAVVAHRARELIVERQGKPTAADLMALAAVSPQIEDPAQAADVFRAFAAKVTDSPYVTALSADSLRHGNAGSFSTAAEQVRSAVPVEE